MSSQQTEKRYVYGTRTGKWYLVDKNDRDFCSGIPQEKFVSMGEDEAKLLYLSPSIFGRN